MAAPGKLGADEGKRRGPEPGHGDSNLGGMVAGSSDMEGTPPDALPPRPGETYSPGEGVPEKKVEDAGR